LFDWEKKKKKRWTEEDVREEAKKDRETMKIKKKMNSLGCLWVRKKWEGGARETEKERERSEKAKAERPRKREKEVRRRKVRRLRKREKEVSIKTYKRERWICFAIFFLHSKFWELDTSVFILF